MFEEENYNFCNINLDFLESSPSLQPQGEQQANKCTDSFSAVQFLRGDPSSRQRVYKAHQLAQRIASTDALVHRVKQLELEQAQLRQQLHDFQQSAEQIKQLYETEKQQHQNLQAKAAELGKKYDTLDSELANKTLQHDQLQAQLEHYKGPVDYSELAVKYLKMAQQLSQEHALHWHHQSLVEELNNYCQQRNLRIPSAKSPKKSPKKRSRISKHEKSIQCELLPQNLPAPIVTHEKKETRCQGTQCDNMIQTRSQGTQHISTTTTRSTSTSCFIKQHHVGTCFPEPAPLPSFDDILRELVNWDNKSLITPIEDNLAILSGATRTIATQVEPQIVEMKTMGTCTYLCNIRKHIDFIPQFPANKRSNSRPPSRIMYDSIKHEASTPPPAATSKPTNTSSIGSSTFLQFASLNNLQPSAFEELWQVFGHMLLGLLHHRNGNQSSITENNPSDAVSQHEFHDWMRSLYESMQQQQQQQQLNQSDLPLCSSMGILSNSGILRPLARKDQERTRSPESYEDRPSTILQQNMSTSPIRFNAAMHDDNILSDKISTTNYASKEQMQCCPRNTEETGIMDSQKSRNAIEDNVSLSPCKESSKESRELKGKRKKHRKLRKFRNSQLQSCESAVDFITSLSFFEDYSTIETAVENNNTESDSNRLKTVEITYTKDKIKKSIVKTGEHSKDLRNVKYSLFGNFSDIECDDEEKTENVKVITSISSKTNEDDLILASEQHKTSDNFNCPVSVPANTNDSYNDITSSNLSEQSLLECNKSLANRTKSINFQMFGTDESSQKQVDEQVTKSNNISKNLIDSDAEDKCYDSDLIIDEQYREEGEGPHYNNGETFTNNSGGDSSNSIEKEFYNLENICRSQTDRTDFNKILSESSNKIITETCSNGEIHEYENYAKPNTPTTLITDIISNEEGKQQPVRSESTCLINVDSTTILEKQCVTMKRTQLTMPSTLPSKRECNPSVNKLIRAHNIYFNKFVQQHHKHRSNKLNEPISQSCLENENAAEVNTKEMPISTVECDTSQKFAYDTSLNTFSENTCSSPSSPTFGVSPSTDPSTVVAITTSLDSVLSIIPIEYNTPASPVILDSSTTEQSSIASSPKEIPLELNATNYPHKHSSCLQRIMACYSSEQYKIINSKYTTTEISEQQALEAQINAQIQKYLESSAENPDVDAATLVRYLERITKDDVLIAKSIVEHMKEVPRPEIELACAIDAVPSKYLGAYHHRISYAMRHLQYVHPEFTNVLLSQIESTLFNYQNVERLSLGAAISLTKLYMLSTSNQVLNMQANPARVFIAKCLYYHQLKAIPMIYEVLCCFPTTLPHREDRTYDRSDALISVIQHHLMCTKYDMENRELPTKELLSKLRFVYHFEPFKPTADEVIANLVEKLKAGKLSNIKYAFAIFCKRLHPTKVTAEVLQTHLIPLANDYNRLVLESSAYDERIAALLDCISAVIKPFPINTKTDVYLSIFTHFLNAVDRSTVQEAAVQSILRLQRFGHVNCFNALLHFKPTYNLHPNTKAMLKTFIHRKPLSFWRTLTAQTALVPN